MPVPDPTAVHRFDNDLTLLFEHRPGPGFALELRLPVGAAHDPAGQEGAAGLLEEWLSKGAGGLGARELADAFDDLGVRCGGGVTHENTRFSLSGLTSDWPRALELLADMLRRPALPEEEWPVLLDLARQDLESLADNPAERLGVALRARAFAPPYAHPVSGTPDSLEQVTPQAARAAHALYGPRGAVLALVADLEGAFVRAHVEATLGDWQGGGAPLPEVRFASGLSAHEADDSQQTHLNLIFRGVGPTEPDWLAFQLALGVLSGGSASRLFEEVREARGLAYSVGASAQVTGGAGFVNVYAGSAPERAAETLAVLLGEFERLHEGVSVPEFERARAGLLAGAVFGAESARGRAAALARDWLTLGRVRPPNELRRTVQALTLPEVNGLLARRPFTQPALMTLGPVAVAAQEGSELHRRGHVSA